MSTIKQEQHYSALFENNVPRWWGGGLIEEHAWNYQLLAGIWPGMESQNFGAKFESSPLADYICQHNYLLNTEVEYTVMTPQLTTATFL